MFICGFFVINLSSLNRHQFILESCYQMLSYLSDIFNALEYKFVYLKSRKNLTDNEDDKNSKLSLSLSSLGRIFIDDDLDYADDHATDGGALHASEDEEYDDEEDEDLCDKLCTFTVTQKEFINQHWYHCHTCKMLDGVGVCNVCAQVCHRGHDVTYSKHGSFFCDCGANEDGSCKALVKRTSNKTNAKSKPKRTVPSQSKSTPSKSSLLQDKKKLMRISKYWYNSLYSHGEFYLVLFICLTYFCLKISITGNCLTITNFQKLNLAMQLFRKIMKDLASNMNILKISSIY